MDLRRINKICQYLIVDISIIVDKLIVDKFNNFSSSIFKFFFRDDSIVDRRISLPRGDILFSYINLESSNSIFYCIELL